MRRVMRFDLLPHILELGALNHIVVPGFFFSFFFNVVRDRNASEKSTKGKKQSGRPREMAE